MCITEQGWREWKEVDWNEALFEHFFRDVDGKDQPVSRILVTEEELINVVSDKETDAHEVKEAFLNVIRTPSHIDFNKKITGYSTNIKVGYRENIIPPFFIILAFSCFVASPTEGDIRDAGDFRKRLAMLLNHDISTSDYPLTNLAHLWNSLSDWIDWVRIKGVSYRRLELPPKDRRVRIGYSINLAFPPRKDQIALVELLNVSVQGAKTTYPRA